MSEHDVKRSSTKQRRSRQTSKQNGTQVSTLQCPANDDKEAWKAYWKQRDQPWRTEPEIDAERQANLANFRAKLRDIDQDSFYGSSKNDERIKLSRADVEWLLATHEKEYGPLGGNRQKHEGLDLRAVDLRGEDLRGLILKKANLSYARLRGANLSEVDLEEANLSNANLAHTKLEKAHLEKANLTEARLVQANLNRAFLQEADLTEAHLEAIREQYLEAGDKPYMHVDIGALLNEAHLEGATLFGTNLEHACLQKAYLEGADLTCANLKRANLVEAHLEGANLSSASLEHALLRKAHIEGANLSNANLEYADLREGDFQGANLSNAHLEHSYLEKAHLEGKLMSPEDLKRIRKVDRSFQETLHPANIQGVFLNSTTNLKEVVLGEPSYGFVSLAGVRWGDADLSIVDWTKVKVLGDEREARQLKEFNGKIKNKNKRLDEHITAVRANRQLAVVLRGQGLSEEADHFAYRAQRLQRIVSRKQRKYGRYLFSGFLDLLAGYGYRPERSIVAYLVIIFGFMGLYLLNSHVTTPHLRWDEALVLSVSSFHGRGFFSQDITLGDTYARLAATEAVVGLVIEISFIATFTQRFFGR